MLEGIKAIVSYLREELSLQMAENDIFPLDNRPSN